MVNFDTREGIMKEWDSWVRYYRSSGGGTWPRDAFESLLDYFDERIERHLSSSSSRAAGACAICGEPISNYCPKCERQLASYINPPPA